MKALIFALSLIVSTSLFASTMGNHKKLEVADQIVSESRKLKGFTIHNTGLEFSNYSLRFAIP